MFQAIITVFDGFLQFNHANESKQGVKKHETLVRVEDSMVKKTETFWLSSLSQNSLFSSTVIIGGSLEKMPSF